jgi:hypothetical protein
MQKVFRARERRKERGADVAGRLQGYAFTPTGAFVVQPPWVPRATVLSCSIEAAPRGALGVVSCPGEHARGHVGHRAVEPQEQRLRWRHPRPLPRLGGPEGVQQESLHRPEDVEQRLVHAGGLVGLVGHGNEVGVGATDGLQRPLIHFRVQGIHQEGTENGTFHWISW